MRSAKHVRDGLDDVLFYCETFIYLFLFFGLRSLNTPQLSLNFIALVWLFITCELIFNIGAVDSFWIEFKMGFGYELRCNNWLMGQSHAHVLYKTTETTTTTPTTTTTTATTVYDILIMLLSNCCCCVESQLQLIIFNNSRWHRSRHVYRLKCYGSVLSSHEMEMSRIYIAFGLLTVTCTQLWYITVIKLL